MKLTKEEIKEITGRLEKGENIPGDWQYKLFPVKQKEYELAYDGKLSQENILNNEDGVFAAPLQIEKTYRGEEWNDGWRNIIAFGDNLQFLKTIYENKDALLKDKVKNKVKLVYIDPPFATRDDLKTAKGNKAYTDKATGSAFIEFLRRRLILAKEILSTDGSIFVHIDWKKGHYIKVLLDEIFGEGYFRNEIVWKTQTASGMKAMARRFPLSHDVIFWYTKSDNYLYQPQYLSITEQYLKKHFRHKDAKGRFKTSELQEPSKDTITRLEKEGLLYETSGGNTRYKQYAHEMEGILIDDVWSDFFSLSSKTKERVDYPTQKPERLIARIIRATTQPGDLVIDFFGGSGTVAAAAEKLGRKWITCDVGKLAFYTMQKRLLNIQTSNEIDNLKKRYGRQARNFVTLYSDGNRLAGNSGLKQQEYRDFVMKLFALEPRKKRINGIKIDGETKNGYPVIIWEYWKLKDSLVNEDFLHDLHSHITAPGERIYIIAPATYVNFFSDYYQIDNVCYFFLKVSDHILCELHKAQVEDFTHSPGKENNLADAISFHFMRPPWVKSEWKEVGGHYHIMIKEFFSHPGECSGRGMKNFESMAMLLIDTNFEGKVFETALCYFAEELLSGRKKRSGKQQKENIKKEWPDINVISLPPIPVKDCGDKMLLVYVDIFGNQFKEEFNLKNDKA